MEFTHVTVLKKEVVDLLEIKEGGVYMDLTLGGGGHSELICQKMGKSGHLYGFDADEAAIKTSQKRLKQFEKNITYIHQNFVHLSDVLDEYNLRGKVDGIVMDLGISSYQLADNDRGFSFSSQGPLDMRFGESELTAAKILNSYSQDAIASILKDYGDERFAKAIAKAIVWSRKKTPFTTADELTKVVEEVYRGKPKPRKIHVATKTFQALRIAVNHELDHLKEVLGIIPDALRVGGRVAIISFHSLEDRMVKQSFRYAALDCVCPPNFPECRCEKQAILQVITRKAVKPSNDEIKENPRSRSARLRVAERLSLAE